ncbi:MAG: nucleotidyltransferase domain-containing protein [Rhodanobacter sp.]|nr:MAG: nucleotidyltransferase domain-containing protein [Rhodanobacter sp.]
MTAAAQAIVLYGSVARGDDDSWSDLDVLVLGPSPELPGAVLASLRDDLPLRVSHYTWKEFASMRATGSLFLRHLAQEASPLHFDGEGEEMYEMALRCLPPYQHVERDIRSFRLGVKDVLRGLAGSSPPLFEMSVLGGIARHASVLACYLKGAPFFGRQSIPHGCRLLGVSDLSEQLVSAHRYRLYANGQCPWPRTADRTEADAAASACARLIDVMESYVNAHTN